MREDILDLAHQVRDAKGWLSDAITTASEFCTDPDTGKSNGWTAMETVLKHLYASKVLLDGALESVQKDIADAQAYQDEMAGRADGLSL